MSSYDQVPGPVPGALPTQQQSSGFSANTLSSSQQQHSHHHHQPSHQQQLGSNNVSGSGPGHVHHYENDPIIPASGMGGGNGIDSGLQARDQAKYAAGDNYGDQQRAEFARGDSKMLSNPGSNNFGNNNNNNNNNFTNSGSGIPQQQQQGGYSDSNIGNMPQQSSNTPIVTSTNASGFAAPSQQPQSGLDQQQSGYGQQQSGYGQQQSGLGQQQGAQTGSGVGRNNSVLTAGSARKETTAPHVDTKTPALDKLHLMGKLVDSLGVCMMTTRCPDSGHLTSRPMQVRHRDLTDLYFITSLHSPKLLDLSRDDHVNISFLHESSGEWCSLNGTAEIIRWSDCAGPQCSHTESSGMHGVRRRLSKDILNKLWTPNMMHWSSNVASTTTTHQHTSKSTHRAPEGVQSDLAIIYVRASSVHYGSASGGIKSALKRAVGGTPKGSDLIVREITNEEIDAARLVLDRHEE